MTFANVIHTPCIERRAGTHRIALIRLAFRSYDRAQSACMRARSAAATIARFAVSALSIAKIII
ncbi:hypothetical protein [Burkholderia sp. BCC0397]|uniref:hypothetical protein n=1 Tax=Burkholderia sp. BCC0397 TaxID=486876 RepID=UPI00158D7502|nr:hypothetical protein [Burkholderia sp. BCC0397]